MSKKKLAAKNAEPDISVHVQVAEVCMAAYRAACGVSKDSAICDLLADLRHWADANGVDFDDELNRANGHYAAEIEEAKNA